MGKFKIWTKADCPYCYEAQALLLEKGIPHEIIVTDTNMKLLTEIQQKHDWETVPVIIEEEDNVEIFVGGYTDLVEYLERR